MHVLTLYISISMHIFIHIHFKMELYIKGTHIYVNVYTCTFSLNLSHCVFPYYVIACSLLHGHIIISTQPS